jgi:nucleoside-diphosphate-sugar epimerase
MSQRILVTGGAGYIGSIMVPRLLNHGHKVTVIDNFFYRQPSLASYVRNQNLEIVYGDVRDYHLMRNLIKKADIVIPLAAIVGAPACDKDPVLSASINRDAMVWLLNQIGKSQYVIMPTSNSAYGSGDSNSHCDEESTLHPISLYAKDKVLVEEALMKLANPTSFRLATVFGISPRMRLDLLVNHFVYRALVDGYIVLFESHFKRNFIHVHDVASAFEMAIEAPKKFVGEIFNLGLSSANLSKLDLCLEIKKLLPEFTILESELNEDPDKRDYIVSNAKIESIGFTPQISLQEGIKELIKGLPMFASKPYTNL